MTARELHDGWTVRAARGPAPAGFPDAELPATVPGVVHLDLLAAGLIPDPYLDDNEALLAWIGLVDWTYRTTFTPTAAELAAERLELEFDGLDTVASLSLNGETVAEVADQHRAYRVDARGLVRSGENELVVAFRSPIRHANAASLEYGARPGPYAFPFEAIRKSACSFGWDWGIATATSGIWRAVRLRAWSTARLARTLVVATPEGDGGAVTATVSIDRTSDAPLELTVEVAGVRASIVVPECATEATAVVRLDAVERWWPVGHGAQPLYDVTVTLASEGVALDTATRRVGFRSLRWDMEPDADGRPFQLVVNERRIWVKGVNWIPDDAFFPRVDRARYERRLRQAVAANVNLIRVWGGGIYEDDAFFDLADELGLLTWQDFLFACAAYPEDEPLWSEVEAEARDNVSRLAHHASLALLNGNNENTWGFEDWGWKERLEGRTWGEGYYDRLLPSVVAEIAPHVPYTHASPFSPGGGHPNDESSGSAHLWEQWNRQDWRTYTEHTPRFVAEFGWQGPPTWSTLVRAISDDPLTPESPGMIVHQKALDGNVKLGDGLRPHYRVPDDMDTWHWAMQLNQANAVRFALDHFRASAPRTSGAVVWQLNDCWPVTSWAAIDGDEREKPLWFALRDAFAPRVVTVHERDGALVAVASNDADAEWAGELALERRGFDGGVRAAATVPVRIAPRQSATVTIPADVARASDAGAEIVVARLGEVRGLWFFTEARDSALADPGLAVSVERDGDGFAVAVTASALARDVTLLIDKVHPEARVDSALVTLLPGERHVFRVTGVRALAAEQVADPRVLRSGNELVAR